MQTMATDNKAPALLGVSIAFLILTWITVSLRFYVRGILSHAIGADDLIMLAALVLFTVYSGIIIAGTFFGLGQHLQDLSLDKMEVATATLLFQELLYALTTAVTRVSIAVFLLRIVVERWHKVVLLVATFITVAFSTFIFLYGVLQCQPLSHFWTWGPSAGHCEPLQHVVDATFAGTATAGAVDLVYAFLPIAMLWHVQMEKRTKVGVAFILGLGALSSTAVVARTFYIPTLKSHDFTYQTTNIIIWSVVEPGLGITAGSLATLRPLFRVLKSTWRTWKDRNYTSTTATGYRKSRRDAEQGLGGGEGELSTDRLRRDPEPVDVELEVARPESILKQKGWFALDEEGSV